MGKVLDRQDTWKGSAWQPWTQNLYTYVGNNPVNFTDPTGHTPEDERSPESNSGGETDPCTGKGPDVESCTVIPGTRETVVVYKNGEVRFFNSNGVEFSPDKVGEMRYSEGYVETANGVRYVAVGVATYIMTRTTSALKMEFDTVQGLEGVPLTGSEKVGASFLYGYLADRAIPAVPEAGTAAYVFRRTTPTGNEQRIRLVISPTGGVNLGSGWWLMEYEP